MNTTRVLARLTQDGYPTLVGFLLGLFQTGSFFQLTFTFSSSYSTFLLVTLCWLLGSAIGVFYVARLLPSLNVFLLLALMAYTVISVILVLAPFNVALLPVYVVLIAATGIYPGVFFGRLSAIYSARTLFFRENNGFVLGLVSTTILFMMIGRAMLWVSPWLVSALVYAMGNRVPVPKLHI